MDAQARHRIDIIALVTLICAIISTGAALIVVPEFRTWMGLDNRPNETLPKTAAEPKPSSPVAVAVTPAPAQSFVAPTIPHIDINDLIPFQREGRVSRAYQKTISDKLNGKRVTVSGYLVSKHNNDPLMDFAIASRPGETFDSFNLQMPRSKADSLIRTPTGTFLTVETTLVVPLLGAAVGNDAKILKSVSE